MATQTLGNKRPSASRGGPAKSPGAPPVATRAAGVKERDEVYGLVSVLYHALQGAETYGKYIEDARRGNDAELVEFFEEAQDEENERALRAKRLLATRLEGFAEDEDAEDEDEDEDDEEGDEDEEDDEEEED
jgi:hypothetical protein